MTTLATSRRHLLPAVAAVLAGCGGGGSTDDAPTIAQFSADRADDFVGDSARLRIRYGGGTGRVEPGIGAVGSDSVVGIPVLDRPTTFRLTVSGTGGRVSREITRAEHAVAVDRAHRRAHRRRDPCR